MIGAMDATTRKTVRLLDICIGVAIVFTFAAIVSVLTKL